MDKDKIPSHVAIIMDGNGRWAKRQQLPRTQGHVEGVRRVEEIVGHARDVGINVLTLYAFSTENWTRPQEEVSVLMNLFISALSQKAAQLHQNGIQIRFIGSRTGVPNEVLKAMDKAEDLTRQNDRMTLNVAFNYGSRFEIISAVKSLALDVQQGQLAVDAIDDEAFAAKLYTHGQPDVDLLIRTSGEVRISNFLLWQISYAELYFTPKCWPEFTVSEFNGALKDFAMRQRRYGGVDVTA